MQPRPPCEEKRRCGALLRLRKALLLRAAAKDINLVSVTQVFGSLWRSAGSL